MSMADTATIVFETQDGNHVLRLNRPSALNAFDESMLKEWHAVLNGIEDKSKPLIITGTGRAFCAGGDLKKYLSRLDDIAGLRGYFNLLAEVFAQIADYPGATIAAINGVTVAGGIEVMCLCDLAVSAESARFADGHVNYGLHPGGGASATLVWLLGERRARWLILSGEFIDAVEAERIGLINRIVPDNTLLEEAQRMASTIGKHLPSSIRRIKHLMKRDIRSVLEKERDSLLEHFQAPETKERLEFFAKRNEKRST
jgi:enoyl-CoA hydratase